MEQAQTQERYAKNHLVEVQVRRTRAHSMSAHRQHEARYAWTYKPSAYNAGEGYKGL